MNREELLVQKSQEVQEALEQWVQELSLLGPREQVVFSMRIEQTPLVASEEIADVLLDLPLPQFFTMERCKRITGDVSLSNKVYNRLYNTRIERIETVRDLLDTPRSEILKLRNVGDIMLQRVEEVLSTEGLSFPD